jgi:hypothetical protein
MISCGLVPDGLSYCSLPLFHRDEGSPKLPLYGTGEACHGYQSKDILLLCLSKLPNKQDFPFRVYRSDDSRGYPYA